MTGKHKAQKDEGPRLLLAGRPDLERCDNKISTSKYSLLSFIPVVSQRDSCYAFVPKDT
jgi:hypothetical protein